MLHAYKSSWFKNVPCHTLSLSFKSLFCMCHLSVFLIWKRTFNMTNCFVDYYWHIYTCSTKKLFILKFVVKTLYLIGRHKFLTYVWNNIGKKYKGNLVQCSIILHTWTCTFKINFDIFNFFSILNSRVLLTYCFLHYFLYERKLRYYILSSILNVPGFFFLQKLRQHTEKQTFCRKTIV